MKTITIVSSREQKKYVIETEASTMAELTAAMDAAGIDYAGMTLYEGLTKAEYDPAKSEAILPHDVPYKGTVTSDLVFMLTAPQKKIKSGASYQEMRTYIKVNNLGEVFARTYGKNYTHGTLSEFTEFLTSRASKSSSEEETEDTDPLRQAFDKLVNALYEDDIICDDVYDAIYDILDGDNEGDKKTKAEATSPYADSEIDEMFAHM